MKNSQQIVSRREKHNPTFLIRKLTKITELMLKILKEKIPFDFNYLILAINLNHKISAALIAL